MAKLSVPPTKSSFLQIKRDLSFAKEGHELLEQKRQILVIELMGQIEAARRVEMEVVEKMKAAFAALHKALVDSGSLTMGSESLASRGDQRIQVGERRLMGITLSKVKAEHQKPGPQFGLGQGGAATDEVVKCFFEALEAISRLAEVENAVFRLARELRKTQRRVNALDKIFIPDYSETLKYIESTLEEREREGMVVMRMVKRR